MISVRFQGKPFSITVIQVCTPTIEAEEAEVDSFYEDLQDLLELTSKKDPFHHRGLECKSRKSRDTWSNRQVWPWSTKTHRVLSREHPCHTKHLFPATKERVKLKKVRKTTRPFRYDLNQMLYDYTVDVTNRFKGLYLVDREPEELWTKVCNIV